MDHHDPVTRSRLRAGGVAALGLLAAAGIFWLVRPARTETPAKTAPALEEQRPETIAALVAPATVTVTVDRTEPAADEIPLMQAGSEDNTEHGPRRPHPIDATRLRIYRENNLIGAMNQAMDLGRALELRELNAQYREDYPEDEHNLQRAYDLIADCQEELTDERQAAAREFWKKHRSSQLRRFVRRHCRL